MPSRKTRILQVFTVVLLLTFCRVCTIQAQDWAVFNPVRQYNYAAEGAEYPEFCIKVDSFSVSDSDTVFYLNKIIREWEDGSQDNEPVFYQYNHNHLLQDSVYETDTSFVFSGVENFEILKYSGNTGSWDFDSDNTIQAHYSEADTMDLFGHIDSIVSISLSTGDSIFLSKSFGIVRFDPVYEDNQFFLLGVENVTGSQAYDYRDVYDFDVGDIFEYEWDRFDPGGSRDGFYRTKILERNESEDDISYVLMVNEVTLDHWENRETQSKYTSTVSYSFEKDASENALPGQMLDLRSSGYYCPGNGEVFQVGYADSLLYGNIKFIDNNYFACEFVEDKPGILKSVESEWGERYQKACAPGLGIVYSHFFCFEQDYHMRLRAYRKNGISYGTFKPDYIYLSKEERTLEQGVSIYPNPAMDIIHIDVDNNESISEIKIFSASGTCLYSGSYKNTLDVSKYPAGVYFIIVNSMDNSIQRKILVR